MNWIIFPGMKNTIPSLISAFSCVCSAAAGSTGDGQSGFSLFPTSTAPFYLHGGRLIPRLSVAIDALLLSRNDRPTEPCENEVLRASRKLAPADLLLVWGPAAAAKILREVTSVVYQGRLVTVTLTGPQEDQERFDRGFSNCHIIPDPQVPGLSEDLAKLRLGDHVRISGYLVDVRLMLRGDCSFTTLSPWFWETSINPLQHGDHGCKTVFTQCLEIL
jgi:hypothetical protein